MPTTLEFRTPSQRIVYLQKRVAELEIENERLVKARERSDEDAATDIKTLRTINNDLANEKTKLMVDMSALDGCWEKRLERANAKLTKLIGAVNHPDSTVNSLMKLAKECEPEAYVNPSDLIVLRDCPLCGSKAEKYKDGDGPCWGFAARCTGCGVKTEVNLKDIYKGLMEWNARV